MSTDALYHQPLMPHLLIDGLNRYNDEPCLFLGDKVASYREVRESTMTQPSLESLFIKMTGKELRE